MHPEASTIARLVKTAALSAAMVLPAACGDPGGRPEAVSKRSGPMGAAGELPALEASSPAAGPGVGGAPAIDPDKWKAKGSGKERTALLQATTSPLAGGALGEWLIMNAGQLTDQDEAFMISLSNKLPAVPPLNLAGAINAASSPELKKRLLSALTEQTYGLMTPGPLFELAAVLQPSAERNELVKSSIQGWLQTNPSYAISSAGKALETVQGGDDDPTRAYIQLAPAFVKVPKDRRDEVWQQLPSADPKMRDSIVFRLVEGQYRNDSLDATQWLNSLPPSPIKSHAVHSLVSFLISDNDLDSARAWADSAADYLTPSDKANIGRALAEAAPK